MKVTTKNHNFMYEGILSWDAIGLMSYIVHEYGNDRTFKLADMLFDFKGEEELILNCIKNLIACGFLEEDDLEVDNCFKKEGLIPSE